MATSLSLPPYNFLIINFITLPLFFLFLVKKSFQHKNIKLFFFYGWLFGFGFFITNLYWISISLTFDQNFSFLIPFALILIPAFLALFYGLISYFFIIFKSKKIIVSFLIFSLIFGIVEFIRGSILTGFPWNLIVYSFSEQLEILSIISIIGTYGFNLFCISLFTCPAIILLRDTKYDLVVCFLFFITTVIFFIYGSSYKNNFNLLKKEAYDYKIRLIGSNISLNRFYFNTDPVSVIEDLIKLSKPEINEKIIFIWPESILPDILQEELPKYHHLFNEKFNENHLIALGINKKVINESSKDYFNTFSVYDNNLNLLYSYSKIKLVPFGEFLPMEKFLSKIGLKSITNNYQSFSRGNKRDIIKINQKNYSIKILPLICYEIIYSGKLFENSNFDLIINISEDGWFGESIGPKQHFAHSIFRAIESGKYLLRSANNGITAIINPLGIVEKKIDYKKSQYIDFYERRKIQPTVFSIY